MSIAHAIAPHLPYLRRFARLLTGSQRSGDAYAAATLEALIADPSAFDRALDPRTALYRVFLKVWDSVPINHLSDEPSGLTHARVGHNLSALTPPARVAFLISAVEGFTHEQVAEATGRDPAELAGLIDEAGREIARQMATDVLIIEDEPLIAMDLEALLQGLGHRVIEVARTRQEAAEAVRRRQPGLILADIQLADGSSGVDAVNDILETLETPVIFITAYPERFLTGERPEPAFLITKPFRPATVKAVVSQALFFDQRSRRPDRRAAG